MGENAPLKASVPCGLWEGRTEALTWGGHWTGVGGAGEGGRGGKVLYAPPVYILSQRGGRRVSPVILLNQSLLAQRQEEDAIFVV